MNQYQEPSIDRYPEPTVSPNYTTVCHRVCVCARMVLYPDITMMIMHRYNIYVICIYIYIHMLCMYNMFMMRLSRSADFPVKLANPAQSSCTGIRPLVCHLCFLVGRDSCDSHGCYALLCTTSWRQAPIRSCPEDLWEKMNRGREPVSPTRCALRTPWLTLGISASSRMSGM